jgi:hypothetical protein
VVQIVLWHYPTMEQEEADLKTKIRQAIKPLRPPIGVIGSPEVLVERDSDDEVSIFVLFHVSGKAKSGQLLEYTRAIEAAAGRAAPTVPTYVRFEPRRTRVSSGST